MSAARYQQRPRIAWREIEGEAVLVDPGKGSLLVLNATGLFLWQRLEAAASAEELAERLCDAFETDYQQALADVRGFVDALAARDLIEVQSASK